LLVNKQLINLDFTTKIVLFIESTTKKLMPILY